MAGRAGFGVHAHVALVVVVVVALAVVGLPASAQVPEVLGSPSPTPVGDGSVAWSPGEVNRTVVGGAPDATPRSVGRGEEVVGSRTATSKTFRNADGSFATVVWAAPVHYRDASGGWQPVDNRLVPVSGGWRNAANDFVATLPSQGSGRVRVERHGRWVSMALDAAAPAEGRASGAAASYAHARRGVDLELAVQTSGVKETLTLRDSTTARSFSYTVATSAGLVPVVKPDGAVDFVAADGQVAFSFAAPFMIDAAGVESGAVAVAMVPTASGWRYTITASEVWLDAPERVWPVIVDPTVTFTADRDCTIYAGDTTTNQCGWGNLRVANSSSGHRRALVFFDVVNALRNDRSGGPVRVRAAELGLKKLPASVNASVPIGLHELTEAWNGSPTTWTARTASANWTTAGGTHVATAVVGATEGVNIPSDPSRDDDTWSSATDWLYWYPTELVQRWFDGDAANHGMLLKSNASTSALVDFYSANDADPANWPQLRIEWERAVGTRAEWTYQDFSLSPQRTVQVNVGTGDLRIEETDAVIAGTAGLDLRLDRTYSELSNMNWDYGAQWHAFADSRYGLFFYNDAARVAFNDISGWTTAFIRQPDGTYLSTGPMNASLVRHADKTWTLTLHRTGMRYDLYPGGLFWRLRDRNDNAITFAYAAGTTDLASITDTQGRVTTFTYGANTEIATITDPAGRVHSYGYDAGEYLTSYTNPNGKTTTYTPDSSRRLGSIVDAEGNETRFTWYTTSEAPWHSRIKTITRVTDRTTGAGHTTSYTYYTDCSQANAALDATQCTRVTDANGHTTTHHVDGRGRNTKTVDAAGNARSSSYTANSDVADYTNRSGAATTTNTYSTDGRHNLESVTVGTGTSSLVSSYAYSAAGTAHQYLPIRFTNPQGNRVNYGYDAKARMNCVNTDQAAAATCTNPGDGTAVAGQWHLDHNADGTLARRIDPNGNTTHYTWTYSSAGLLTSSTVDHPAPRGDETVTYDTLGRVTSRTDGNGQTVHFNYDVLDRMLSQTYPGNIVVSYTYDTNGNRRSMTDPTGTTTYDFNALSQLTKETLPGPRTNSYTYDPVGNLATFTDAGGTITYTYDNINQLESLTEAATTTTFAYNANGHRTRTTFPTGLVEAADIDDAGRVKWIVGCPASVNTCDPNRADAITKYTYTYTNPTTNADTALRHSVTDRLTNTTSYSYDSRDRLTGANTSGPNPSTYAYTYDAASNRLTQTIGSTTTRYAHNAANHLCWSKTATSATACASPPTGATTYTYDANGNQTGSSAGQQLIYNSLDQTTSMRATTTSTVLTATYQGPNQVNRATTTANAVTTTHTNSILGLTRSGSTRWVRDNTGQLLYQRNGTTRGYYLRDGLGSTAAVIDTTGVVRNRYTYDPYGATTQTCDTTLGCLTTPWRYTGQYFDGQTGLYKIGHRYYQPTIGRWTQPDPSGADANAYTYTGGDPANQVDPTGLHTSSWGDGECSWSRERLWPIYDFHRACHWHDQCLEVNGAFGPCDTGFLITMKSACRAQHDSSFGTWQCYVYAYEYYWFVSRWPYRS